MKLKAISVILGGLALASILALGFLFERAQASAGNCSLEYGRGEMWIYSPAGNIVAINQSSPEEVRLLSEVARNLVQAGICQF